MTARSILGENYNLKFKNGFPLKVAFLIFIFVFSIIPWFSFAEVVDSTLRDIYGSTLDKGLKTNEPYSYILIKKSQTDPSNARGLLTEAIKYSPNLPVTYFELAKLSFSFSPEDIFESIDYTIDGFEAYKRNFWWLRSITGLLFISFISSFVIALMAVICIRFFIESPLLSHDMIEDKKKVLMVLSLIPLSLLGPLFFIAGTLSLLGLYFRNIDKTIVYMSILLLLLSPLFLRITNTFLSTPSPELRAIIAVNESRDNKYALSVLKGKNDFVSLFSYSLALKREGRYEEAIEAYKNLLSASSSPRRGSDEPRVYVNMGNCYFGINDMASAKDFYKKSIDMKPLVSAYYNLSQVSREMLDFAKGEEYFLEARKLSRESSLSRFTSTASKNPNRFVIDETLPMSTLWRYADNRYKELIRISPINSAITVVIAIALAIIFYMIDTRMKYRAYRCKRCNAILCGRCAKEILWGQMCPRCYKSIVKLDELDSKERVAKVLEVQGLQSKRRNRIKVLSLVFPGVAHIYAGKILEGSLFLWLSIFLLVLILLNPLSSTGLSLFSHVWLTIPSLVLMAVLYLISNIAIRRRLNRGWL